MGFLNCHKLAAAVFAAFFIAFSTPACHAEAVSSHAQGQHLQATKEQLQALFIKRITKYVLGPDKRRINDTKPVIVAAIDPRGMSHFFKRPDGFRLVRWPYPEIQVLFLDSDNPRVIAAVLHKVKSSPILTIGRNPDFLRMGGIINLVESHGRLKLQVNICAAREAGLTISSKLLKLSEIYCGDDLE